ncbi:MAG: 30S ribosomal protein S4 [candidate division WOR-3 bacterium]|nr:30S ribosomal protein S4 [candidate division WOR-3 bacterium]
MGRYTDAKCRRCRRLGMKLYLKGDSCYSEKCPLEGEKFINPPGEHPKHWRSRSTPYGLQLKEKERVREIYGLRERQFRNLFDIAAKMEGVTGGELLKLLERRLDNVVYRLGLAMSRSQARQVINHGHIKVNGRKVDIPSYEVSEGNVISVCENSKKIPLFSESLAHEIQVKDWLIIDREKMEGKVSGEPSREDIEYPIKENLIVELYSK